MYFNLNANLRRYWCFRVFQLLFPADACYSRDNVYCTFISCVLSWCGYRVTFCVHDCGLKKKRVLGLVPLFFFFLELLRLCDWLFFFKPELFSISFFSPHSHLHNKRPHHTPPMSDVQQGQTDVDAKVILLGMSDVGKTCLFQRFLNDRFVADSSAVCILLFLPHAHTRTAWPLRNETSDYRCIIWRKAHNCWRERSGDWPVGHRWVRALRINDPHVLPGCECCPCLLRFVKHSDNIWWCAQWQFTF